MPVNNALKSGRFRSVFVSRIGRVENAPLPAGPQPGTVIPDRQPDTERGTVEASNYTLASELAKEAIRNGDPVTAGAAQTHALLALAERLDRIEARLASIGGWTEEATGILMNGLREIDKSISLSKRTR